MTMRKLPLCVTMFANGDNKIIDVYDGVRDYFCHYMSEVEGKNIGVFDSSRTLAVKEQKINTHLFAEIKRLSQQNLDSTVPMAAWAKNPMVVWAAFQTTNMMIDAIIPDTIIKKIGGWVDLRYTGFGETATFDIEPNQLMTVSQGANAQRTSFRQKQFKTSKTLIPINHAVTVTVSLYKVLSGVESLASFIRKAILAIETSMTNDAYDALNALVDAGTFPTELRRTGYTQDGLLELCETTTAYNHGNKATIVGTTVAVSKVLPNASNGNRIVTNSSNIEIQLIKNFFDYDILVLPQVATGINYGTKLLNNRLYIMSTSSDKVVKGVVEGTTLQNSNDYYDNADLTSNATFNKRWIFEGLTNSTMGLMTLS